MRKILPFILLICIGFTTVNAQSRGKLEDLINIKGVSAVLISKNMLDLIPESVMKSETLNLSSVINKIESIIVLNTEQEEAFEVLSREVKNYIKNGKFEIILFAKDEDESKTTIYSNESKKSGEFILFTEDGNELSVVCIVGDLTTKTIKELINK